MKHRVVIKGGSQGDVEIYCSCGERIAYQFLPISWKKARRLVRKHKREVRNADTTTSRRSEA